MISLKTIHILPNKKVKILESEQELSLPEKQFISFIASIHIPEDEIISVIGQFIDSSDGFILSRPSTLCSFAFNTSSLVYVDKSEREIIVNGHINKYLSNCNDLTRLNFLKDCLYIHRQPNDEFTFDGFNQLQLPEYIKKNYEYETMKNNPLLIGSHIMAKIRIEEMKDFCSPNEFLDGNYEKILFE
ncbi:hypothetical protein DMUE_1860 [Dictyocoela muelleri]|nr:hypothetical protein DMUE_1860 [Dictyocoela muelleri]